jgi:hypothetical protein
VVQKRTCVDDQVWTIEGLATHAIGIEITDAVIVISSSPTEPPSAGICTSDVTRMRSKSSGGTVCFQMFISLQQEPYVYSNLPIFRLVGESGWKSGYAYNTTDDIIDRALSITISGSVLCTSDVEITCLTSCAHLREI